VPWSAASATASGVVKFEENTPPVVVFGVPWDYFFHISFL
jgi:hypothetical protein